MIKHTDRQTHTHTHMDKLTYIKHWARGPMKGLKKIPHMGDKAYLDQCTSKVNKHTDRQTDRHTHIWTNPLIESIGPEGCFENSLSFV